MSKAAAMVSVEGVLEAIGEALTSGDEVRIQGFRTFVTRDRPAGIGRNPGTGEQVELSASIVPALKAQKTLKDAVNSLNAGRTGSRRGQRTREAGEGQQVEIKRLRYDDRWRRPFHRADRRAEARLGIVGLAQPTGYGKLAETRQRKREQWH